MNFIITYDIPNDKRRKKISDELEAFGIRVNYSVFECELNKTKLKRLRLKLEEIIDKKDFLAEKAKIFADENFSIEKHLEKLKMLYNSL